MPTQVNGRFDVKLTPEAPDASGLGRLIIDKTFHGELDARSQGQMLAVSTDVKGSAGYVAMERVTGTLAGRSGSFVLQHSGTMTRGHAALSVTVVPDSGTDQLAGLSGTMTISIVEKDHLYEFAYTLP